MSSRTVRKTTIFSASVPVALAGSGNPMCQAFSDPAPKVRAVLIGIVTDRDNVVKRVPGELIDALWFCTRDVDPDLFHCLNGKRIYTGGRLCARREDIQRRIKGTQKSFRHLGACAVSGAENQNALFGP